MPISPISQIPPRLFPHRNSARRAQTPFRLSGPDQTGGPTKTQAHHQTLQLDCGTIRAPPPGRLPVFSEDGQTLPCPDQLFARTRWTEGSAPAVQGFERRDHRGPPKALAPRKHRSRLPRGNLAQIFPLLCNAAVYARRFFGVGSINPPLSACLLAQGFG